MRSCGTGSLYTLSGTEYTRLGGFNHNTHPINHYIKMCLGRGKEIIKSLDEEMYLYGSVSWAMGQDLRWQTTPCPRRTSYLPASAHSLSAWGKQGTWPLPHCAGQDGSAMGHQSGRHRHNVFLSHWSFLWVSIVLCQLLGNRTMYYASWWHRNCSLQNEMADEYSRKPSLMSSTQTHL